MNFDILPYPILEFGINLRQGINLESGFDIKNEHVTLRYPLFVEKNP